jgi:hypothetical protein
MNVLMVKEKKGHWHLKEGHQEKVAAQLSFPTCQASILPAIRLSPS